MYFYIIKGPFRVGFGITKDHERREKDYTGAWGDEAHFTYLFEGSPPQIKNLEFLIKTQYSDMCWVTEEWDTKWKTEWLDNGWTVDQLLEFIKNLIAERHMPVKQIR